MPLPHGRGTAYAHAYGHDIEPFVAQVAGHGGVEEVLEFDQHDDAVGLTVQIGKGGGGFLRPMMDAGTIPRTPFEVRDGWVEWEFATDQNHAKQLMKSLKDEGIPHHVISFSKADAPRLLTHRQREVFDLAVRHGYYEKPRRITLTNLATEIGVSKSTLCEMIHLIERHIVEEFADAVRHQSPQN